MSKIVIGVIVVIVVAFLGYRYFGGGEAPQPAPAPAPQAEAPAPAQAAGQAVQEAAQQAGQAVQEAAQQVAAGAAGMAQSLASLKVGDVEIGNRIATTVEGLQSALAGITDQASGEAAKAKIEEAAKAVDELSAQVAQLPDDGKKLLASTLAPVVPALRAAADKVGAIEGVGAQLKPTLDAAITKLEDWAKQAG